MKNYNKEYVNQTDVYYMAHQNIKENVNYIFINI